MPCSTAAGVASRVARAVTVRVAHLLGQRPAPRFSSAGTVFPARVGPAGRPTAKTDESCGVSV